MLAGAAAAVIVALVVGGILWNSSRDEGGEVNESVLNQNASLIIGAPNAATTIDVFEDFLCPYCKQFEEQSGPAIQRAVDAGTLRVRYHMLTFLNQASASGDYSSRAAGALQCVGGEGQREVFAKFHAALFAAQPAENGNSDLSNADLARIAAEQGATPDIQQCISSGAKVAEANTAAEESQNQLAKATGGQAATPTVLSGGDPVGDIMNGTGWLDNLLAKNKE